MSGDALDRKLEEGYRAFRIYHNVQFPNGFKLKKADYYETKDKVTIDLCTRALEATCQEIPLKGYAPIAAPSPRAEDRVVEPGKSPEDEEQPEGLKTDEPDWSYCTKPEMRIFLDACGVELPAKAALKGAHELLCKETWAAGIRPHPLWGIPGGPHPAPGHPGPDGNDPEVVRAAIENAEAVGLIVPQVTWDWLDSLTTTENRSQLEPDPQDKTDATEEEETISDDKTEDMFPPDSAHEKAEEELAEATTEE